MNTGKPHMVRLDTQEIVTIDRKLTVGRLPDCDYVVTVNDQSAGISGRHASIEVEGEYAWIEDLGSTNGTWVRGARIAQRTPLLPGERFLLDRLEFEYRGVVQAAESSAPVAEKTVFAGRHEVHLPPAPVSVAAAAPQPSHAAAAPMRAAPLVSRPLPERNATPRASDTAPAPIKSSRPALLYIILVLGVVALAVAGLALLSGCARKDTSGASTAPGTAGSAATSDQPLETRERNARDYQPAFAGQTRARGIHNSAPVEVRTLARGLTQPWAVEQLPDGRLLVTEKPGNLRIVSADGKVSPPVGGVPVVRFNGQAGLLDVALDPAFATSHIIYFCYSEQREGGSGIALARARLVEAGASAQLQDVKVIFRALPTIESDRQLGSRIAFARDGKLLLTLGERGIDEAVGQAQNLRSDFGKLVRLNPDGTIPRDNPFVGRKDAQPEIWSYGHRDAQSLAVDALTGKIWSIEHGPRGGDELNLIKRGANYGWPIICYGIDYSGAKVGTGITQHEGMEQPVYYWDPVIAPSGMTVYRGAMFPEWQGSIFVGGLVGMKLVRLQMDGDRVSGEEWLLQDVKQRIRDVQQGSDGAIYVLTENGADSSLLRLARKQGP